jgi:DNA-directed RNA polymerase subunit alpha
MLIIPRPEVKPTDKEISNRQSFTIKPLQPGFGHTLGNSLRRTLLSSIPGAAATNVKFDGFVVHEFVAIEGVKEDVQDICLNLKDILFTSTSEEPVVVSLEKKGAGAVLASDLKLSDKVEVLNPNLHIATLTSKESSLKFELTVAQGFGYRGAEKNKGAGIIGVIPLDSIFTPVRRVSFEVVPYNDESKSLDSLTIEIETDGTVSPRESLASATKTLQELLSAISEVEKEAKSLEVGNVKEAEASKSEWDNMRIEELGLTERSRNCLKRAGINTVAQLMNATQQDLTSITNFGQTSLKDVTDRLAERGLSLRVEE